MLILVWWGWFYLRVYTWNITYLAIDYWVHILICREYVVQHTIFAIFLQRNVLNQLSLTRVWNIKLLDDINNNNYKNDANKTTLYNVENVTFPHKLWIWCYFFCRKLTCRMPNQNHWFRHYVIAICNFSDSIDCMMNLNLCLALRIRTSQCHHWCSRNMTNSINPCPIFVFSFCFCFYL